MGNVFANGGALRRIASTIIVAVTFLVSCDVSAPSAKSAQALTSHEREMVKALLHEALERTFSDYYPGKIYQSVTVHKDPRDYEKELNPPIEGVSVKIGMFSPQYHRDEIEKRIRNNIATISVSPNMQDAQLSIDDYIVEFYPGGGGGGSTSVIVVIIPLSVFVK